MSINQSKPVTIRGVSYKDQHEAATSLGVGQSTISRAMMRGTLDNVGLGLHRGVCLPGPIIWKPIPVTIGGVTYRSKQRARKELSLGIIGLEAAIRKEKETP